ncbi:MAG: helix-turn-helix transcriptional regulator [Geminicoccaceae bacterium]
MAEETLTQIQPPATRRLIRISDVVDKVGMSRAWIYNEIAKGRFPVQRCVGGRSAWLESEVDEWIERLPQKAIVS